MSEIISKLTNADTRDILSIIVTLLFVYGTVKGIFDPTNALTIVTLVIGYWFGQKVAGNGGGTA